MYSTPFHTLEKGFIYSIWDLYIASQEKKPPNTTSFKKLIYGRKIHSDVIWETKGLFSFLSWGDFMIILYSLTLCFMPKNGCCIFKVGPGEGEALGSLVGFFKASLPRRSRVQCGLGFAWLAWLC